MRKILAAGYALTLITLGGLSLLFMGNLLTRMTETMRGLKVTVETLE